MLEFFKGWRRKIGVVTMVLACVFAVGWVRSLAFEDELILHTTESINRRRLTFQRYHAISGSGMFGLITEHIGIGSVTEHSSEINAIRSRLELEMFNWTATPGASTMYPWLWGDLSRKTSVYGNYQTNWQSGHWETCDVISYQFVVLPLTLLSAWLLLSKPRKPKADSKPEPLHA